VRGSAMRAERRKSLPLWLAALYSTAILVAILASSDGGRVEGARSRLKHKIFGSGLTPLTDRITTSDPANQPLSVAAFLEGRDENGPLVQSWQNAIQENPITQKMEQQVLTQSQHQAGEAGSSDDAALLETEWVHEGKAASKYEPKAWPLEPITPNPYQHLTHKHGGGDNDHSRIEGALGVQSAAVPWDYRHYSGNLNSHRKAEPLIYTPLVIAKGADGTSAVDLTSIINKRYQSQRMSSNPQYANTLSALTDYKPVQLHPTDHWLPQVPLAKAPGVKEKYWEKHFLDLYAPTPPPLLAPVAPQPPKSAKEKAEELQKSLLEIQSVGPLPDVIRQREHVRPLISAVTDAENNPVPFVDQQTEDEQNMRMHEVDIMAPAHAQQPIVAFIEMEEEIEKQQDQWDQMIQEMEVPPKREEEFPW
jgi:hypothetical protein